MSSSPSNTDTVRRPIDFYFGENLDTADSNSNGSYLIVTNKHCHDVLESAFAVKSSLENRNSFRSPTFGYGEDEESTEFDDFDVKNQPMSYSEATKEPLQKSVNSPERRTGTGLSEASQKTPPPLSRSKGKKGRTPPGVRRERSGSGGDKKTQSISFSSFVITGEPVKKGNSGSLLFSQGSCSVLGISSSPIVAPYYETYINQSKEESSHGLLRMQKSFVGYVKILLLGINEQSEVERTLEDLVDSRRRATSSFLSQHSYSQNLSRQQEGIHIERALSCVKTSLKLAIGSLTSLDKRDSEFFTRLTSILEPFSLNSASIFEGCCAFKKGQNPSKGSLEKLAAAESLFFTNYHSYVKKTLFTHVLRLFDYSIEKVPLELKTGLFPEGIDNKQLFISGENITDVQLERVLNYFGDLGEKIDCVNLEDCHLLTFDSLLNLANKENLKELCVKNCGQILEGLQERDLHLSVSQLEIIRLNSLKNVPERAPAFISTYFPKIKELDLKLSIVSGDVFRGFVSKSTFPQLTTVNVHETEIDPSILDEDFSRFSEEGICLNFSL
jgi:hypothetical protein